MADTLREHGAKTQEDLRELWRRIVFSVLISNTDDHLRNHGFLYGGRKGWTLAPAYDLNPVPVDVRPRILSTAIGFDEDRTASIEIALDVAEHFGLESEAHEIAREVAGPVTRWRESAASVGIGRDEIDRLATAFEHEDLHIARRL
ncbi:MAG: type II toxin-antitoxin system HipA family toxin [Gemmatimonadota bacterium]